MNIDASEIKEHMAVRDSEGREVGKVDAAEGDFLKLKEDDRGHHWLTLDMVERVDEHVHLNLGEAEVRRLWLDEDPNSLEKTSSG